MNHNKSSKYLSDNDFPIKQEIILEKSSSRKENIPSKGMLYPKKNKKKLFLLLGLYMFFSIMLTFGVLKIYDWYRDNQNTSKTIDNIDEIVEVTEMEDTEETEFINEPSDVESDYWYYIKFPLIQVDFTELSNKNTDTIAWIQVNNTNINYPIVQTTNNNYYLNHSFDKTANEAGWVFMDFRNISDFSNKNTIIYAHSRLDKTMFGSLSKVLKADWYQNKDNHIIKISTPTENSLWQIFSVYKIEEETYYITTDFDSDNAYLEFLNTIEKRSKYDFDVSLTESDIILTLSTCYSETERTVVHAKMIKKAARDS